MNPLEQLSRQGQSVWLDYIRRDLIESGGLKRMVDQDALGGVTSNPAIFEKAMAASPDYQALLDELSSSGDLDPMGLYEKVAIRDIQDAADVLRPVYDRTDRRDGFISFEVSPFLAHDTAGTLEQARRLWAEVSRPNLMVKVPGTPEGIPAIEQLVSEGINVNVTLLFAQSVYEQVARAYLSGLEKRAAAGEPIGGVAGVASFFISRIDSAIDAEIEKKLAGAAGTAAERLRGLSGKVAIANAKLTYEAYKGIFSGDRWRALESKGAQPQRVLWASTSTKNPAFRDVLYVEELIGPETVNTMPPATMDAFRDHGEVRGSLEEDLDAARETMQSLAAVGISMDAVTDKLLTQGVRLFAEAFDKLLNAVDKRCRVLASGECNPQSYTVSAAVKAKLEATLEDWLVNGKIRRLWARDASLWSGADESQWLGWLHVTEEQLAHRHHLTDLANDVREAGFTDAMVLGMGGSSLCPEVFSLTFGPQSGFPRLHVLDSTDPAQVKTLEEKVDLAKTVFIVASKSGSTLEPNVFQQYFFDRVRETVGAEQAPKHFIAVTDPGSQLEKAARDLGFRHIFHGVKSIGGRYSALSDFGMVPAAVMGVDTPRFLEHSDRMAAACSPCSSAPENPGVVLGILLGALALEGRDKVTILSSPGIHDLGAWLEQLLAESTGKQGRGLIPVDREPVGPPEVYGNDRVFVHLRLTSDPDEEQTQALEKLEAAGHPVVRIEIPDVHDLGQEWFRWEIATAVAGSILGINPFDQPDVEAAKIAARKLTDEVEQSGSLPAETPFFETAGAKLFADDSNAAALSQAAGPNPSLSDYLRAHLGRAGAGDYVALLAYIEMNEAHENSLQAARVSIRDAKHTATCLGFGPRFLHSTGQAYKGGPNSGVFLQITCDDAVDLPIPGRAYTFGVVKAAQARGDFEVLAERGRRALRLHLGSDVEAGLAKIEAAVTEALQ